MIAFLERLPVEAWSVSSGVGAVLVLAMGGACLHLWWRDREPGLWQLGVAALAISLFYGLDASHLNKPQGPMIAPMVGLPILMLVAIGFWTAGMAKVLGLPGGWRSPLLPMLLLPPVAASLPLMAGVPLPRSSSNIVLTAVFIGVAGLAWRQRQREPGAGHGWVALTVGAIPALALLVHFSGAVSFALRYLVMAPLAVSYLTVLIVTLRRRSQALQREIDRRRSAEVAMETLNASLERSVQQRTADLHDMVAGLESFNRSVSHDLRGPLGGIEGAARLAEEALQRGDTEAARTLLGAIGSQAQTSRALVASLLELARVGDARLARRSVSLEALAREAIADIQRQSAGHRLPAFKLHDLPSVQADADLLRPVLVNLLGNACKFSAGQADPQVEVGAQAHPHQLTVFVRDNGVGFDPERARDLFQPFRRLHGGAFDGHGVGLSIVRRAVERHGGQVWAEGQPGRGACFYFTLPQEEAPDGP
ncbi:MAG: HAMP domain-containing histidine kinase [Burkholderiales bacterium]|nr:HAMP domain-containing histidine kinase [Burkholderiales bacterium]